LEIDLDPGLNMLPLLEGPNALPSLFFSLKRLNIMCYPEIALALPVHIPRIEELELDLCRIPEQPAQQSDYLVIEDLISRLPACPQLRLIKVGVGALGSDFPTATALPKLTGESLVLLSQYCPKLDHVNIFAAQPSAIDGSGISSECFDLFCKSLPQLRSLILKIHPATAQSLSKTALQSLGRHCHELEVVRLRIPYDLTNLPVSSALPQIMVSTPGTPVGDETLDSTSQPTASSTPEIRPLFPHLTHLALARPETLLSTTDHDRDHSSTESHASFSDVITPEQEEDLVHSWAHALITHFPALEVLEAWSDWTGQDNESLNYFLPVEEVLASTWEFLSGLEQDLWDDDELEQEGESWHTLDGSDDWDAASDLNEGFYQVEEGFTEDGVGYVDYIDEEEGEVTPLGTEGGFFENGHFKGSGSAIGPNAPYPARASDRMPMSQLQGLSIA
jgi:hypothetical protein